MRLFRIILLLMLVAPFVPDAYAKGYRVTLAREKVDTSSYVISGWNWGNKVFIDTAHAKNGHVVFSSRTPLNCGNYAISQIDGKKLIEFIVPRSNRDFRIRFVQEGKSFNVTYGNPENKLYAEFQNLINYKWEEYPSAEAFSAKLGHIRNIVAAKLPGSILDIILKNTLFHPKTADEVKETFPFDDPIIIHTQFAEDKVEQYLRLLQYNHNDTIIKYVDEMVSSATDKELQNRLAHTAYQFFYNPSIMGQEGIAVHIAQKWFLDGPLEWPNEEGKFMLRTFVEFNKHSLIGMDAPELQLTDTTGNQISLRDMAGEYTIVYFYTDDCRTCIKETPKLVDLVNEFEDGVLSVYAVYANDNSLRWKDYIEKELFIYNPFMEWVNVYDPDYSSGFQMLYNVVQTPQLFLLDRDKKIIGRGLSVKNLKELFEEKIRQRDELRGFIGEFFNPLAASPQQIEEGIDMFYNSAKTNPETLTEFMREIFLTLGNSREPALNEGAIYLAQKYIVGMPQMWTEQFVKQCTRQIEIYNLNKLGSQANDLDLEMTDSSPIKLSDITTDYKVLYFYRPNCGVCSEVTPKMAALYNEYKEKMDIGFLAINLGSSKGEWIEYITKIDADWENLRATDGDSSQIYREYYLENVPTIYLLKGNVVVAKDINDIELEQILKTITQ